ncbi:MAG: glycosyltransferase family 10 [Methanomassiliicoccales archaeon]
MIEIKVSVADPIWKMTRQSPGRSGIWNDCRFHFDDDLDCYDYWVVYDGLGRKERVRCDPDNTILITAEPPSIKSYNRRFLSQISRVLTFRTDIPHRKLIHSQPAIPWWVGKRFNRGADPAHRFEDDPQLDYDHFKNVPLPKKDKLISVITSGKMYTEGHRKREEFVKQLWAEFGGELDVYSPEGLELVDKWDAISRYRYHVAIENSIYPDYWTEKLADTFLGGALPLYHGCPNCSEYFPTDAVRPINIYEPGKAVKAIRAAIDDDSYTKSLQSVQEARRRILDEYNIFPVLASICREKSDPMRHTGITIWPEDRHPFDVRMKLDRHTWNIMLKVRGRQN